MKKAVFTILNYLLPTKGVLSMHCSANEGASGDTALFLGLSGTGKTTLSADSKRKLIGDDEHGWDDMGIFNIEGGCYAKTAKLSQEQEPEIWNAIRFGSVLENVVYDTETREVDFSDNSITENTRVAYPLEFIEGAKIPAVGSHPKNIIFLTCDAFGVLPPVSKLDPVQAMYHFMNGYSAKVAGTEQGVNNPKATFSACFGSAFMVWNPLKYIFGIDVPQSCPEVPSDILIPDRAWSDKAAYRIEAQKLTKLFQKNFEQFNNQPSAHPGMCPTRATGWRNVGAHVFCR